MILIGTPCYTGSVSLAYLRSIVGLLDALREDGISVEFLTTEGDSLITRARNHIANEFLRQSQHSHLLFIDSDLGFEPAVLKRYLKADKDVVCGVYPVKHLNLESLRRKPGSFSPAQAEAASLSYTVKFKPGAKVDAMGLISVEYASTGFMLLKRRVLEQMAEAYPELKYRYAYVDTQDAVKESYAFFDTAIDSRNLDYLPEDYAFCKRWTALGGEIYADVLSRFVHVGSRAYEGDLGFYLAALKNEKSQA